MKTLDEITVFREFFQDCSSRNFITGVFKNSGRDLKLSGCL